MADEEEVQEEESSEESAPPKGGKLKLIIIIAAVLVIGGGAAAYFLFFKAPATTEEVEPAEGEEVEPDEGEEVEPDEGGKEGETTKTTPKLKEGIIFPLEHFIVNVNDSSGSIRYLKIEIKLELENSDMQAEVENRSPKIRDSVVTILTNKSVDDVSDTKGKQKLKEEIRARINSFLTLGKIQEVYFTDFIIQ